MENGIIEGNNGTIIYKKKAEFINNRNHENI